MGTINFNGVESPENRTSTFKSVQAGLHTLTIASVENITSQSGTAGLEVTFDSKEAEASFKERFWLSGGALPRVLYLMEKFTGTKPTGEMTTDQIAAALTGKTREKVVVDADLITKTKDGKTYNNQYPKLRFAGYVDPQGKDADPIITDKTAPGSSLGSITVADNTDSDLPF